MYMCYNHLCLKITAVRFLFRVFLIINPIYLQYLVNPFSVKVVTFLLQHIRLLRVCRLLVYGLGPCVRGFS